MVASKIFKGATSSSKTTSLLSYLDGLERRVQLTRNRLRSAEPRFGQVRYHLARAIVIDGAGDTHVAASSRKSQSFDMEEGLDGVGLGALGFCDQFAYGIVQDIHARVWMLPAKAIGGGIKLSEPLPRSGRIEQRGTGWDEQLRSLLNLRANVGQHQVGWNGEETASIDRRDGAVLAGMFASACRFRVSNNARGSVQLQTRIAVERGQYGSLRQNQRGAL